jgi:hypothetical protein
MSDEGLELSVPKSIKWLKVRATPFFIHSLPDSSTSGECVQMKSREDLGQSQVRQTVPDHNNTWYVEWTRSRNDIGKTRMRSGWQWIESRGNFTPSSGSKNVVRPGAGNRPFQAEVVSLKSSLHVNFATFQLIVRHSLGPRRACERGS